MHLYLFLEHVLLKISVKYSLYLVFDGHHQHHDGGTFVNHHHHHGLARPCNRRRHGQHLTFIDTAGNVLKNTEKRISVHRFFTTKWLKCDCCGPAKKVSLVYVKINLLQNWAVHYSISESEKSSLNYFWVSMFLGFRRWFRQGSARGLPSRIPPRQASRSENWTVQGMINDFLNSERWWEVKSIHHF